MSDDLPGYSRTCRGKACGKSIRFVNYIKRDTQIGWLPIDPDATPRLDYPLRTLVIRETEGVDAGKFRTAREDDEGPFYTRHHATCPDVGSFKR